MSRPLRSAVGLLVALCLTPVLIGCGRPAARAPVVVTWLAAHTAPAFDPDGPPDALRAALERHLSVGLIDRDTTGATRLGLAESAMVSGDSLVWTFRLRAGVRFTDGTAVTSTDVRNALVGGLGRPDHATRAWLLAAVVGIGDRRAAVPAIDCPDARTLTIRLSRPDRRFLDKLAVPGVSVPFRQRAGAWGAVVGTGPYRVLEAREGHSLTLVAVADAVGARALADTLRVRFVVGASRTLTAMRGEPVDVVWPLPPGILSERLPDSWLVIQRDALPARRLYLVLRPEAPPLGRVEVRAALASAFNREELLVALGPRGDAVRRWLPGVGTDYAWPRIETALERAARTAAVAARAGVAQRAGPTRPESFHVVLAYDADGVGAEIARSLQGQWARSGHYADLRACRGGEVATEMLGAGGSQARLVEAQASITGAEAELATLVLPMRGPAVGSFRTGWRTRDLDRWVAWPEPAPGFDVSAAQSRLAEDRVVLPLATLPWQLAVRSGGDRPVVHIATGPVWTVAH